jgi:hypothetical protein
MEDNSFISGLSSIGEAIGESSYGRCITLWITSCEPSLESLSVRLGGPGSPWHTVLLPMEQPLTIHRPAGVRVLRRATELAIATPAYAQSPAAESEVVHASSDMAAVDVLTNMASTAAGSTVTTIAAGAEEAPDTELVAATTASDGDDDTRAPLRVHLRWAIGELLPGAVLSAEAGEQAAAAVVVPPSFPELSNDDLAEKQDDHEESQPHEAPREFSSLENSPDEADAALRIPSSYRTPFDDDDAAPVTAATTAGAHHDDTEEAVNTIAASHRSPSAPLGDEDSTPSSSGKLSPFNSPPTADAPVPPAVVVPRLSGLRGDDHDEEPHHTGITTESSNATAKQPIDGDEDRNGSADGVHSNHPLHPTQQMNDGVPPIRTQSLDTSLPAPLTVSQHKHGSSGHHAEARDAVAVSFDDIEFTPQHREASMAMSVGHSSSRSNTPRRQRPQSARRSTVQMDLAPVMGETLELRKAEASVAATAEDSVHISDDDDDSDLPQHVMHLPPPPPPPAASEYSGAEKLAESPPQQQQQHASAHTLHFDNAIDHGSTPVIQKSRAEPAAAASPPAVLRPCVENLFEGAAASELLVTVAVVAVTNTKGAADLHRVVSVNLTASAAALDTAKGSTCVSFHTTPMLRSVAGVVPQMSSPALLTPSPLTAMTTTEGRGEATNDCEEHKKSTGLLHAACTVTEMITVHSSTSSSTVLWTANADVSLAGTADSPCSSPVTQEVRFDGANGDVVITRWTVLTVGAYRDAALNLRCRADEPGQPTLQLLLVADERNPERKESKHHARSQTSVPVHVWVSAPGSQASVVQHRLAAAATVHSLVQQPIQVAMQDPLGYIALHIPQLQSRRAAKAHLELIFFGGFSDEWTRTASLKHASVTLYYRVVAPAASLRLPTLTPQLPGALLGEEQAQADRSDAAKVLREVVVTVKPPTSLLTSLFTALPFTAPHAAQTMSPADSVEPFAPPSSPSASPSPSSWTLRLRHAATHAVLAESTVSTTALAAATPALTYRCFLPLTLEEASVNGGRGAYNVPDHQQLATASGMSATTNADFRCLPLEVELNPVGSSSSTKSIAVAPHASSSLPSGAPRSFPSPPPNWAARRNSRSAIHDAVAGRKRMGSLSDRTAGTAWTGALFISYPQLYTASDTATHLKTTLCVSAPLSCTADTTALQSAATLLGALVTVHCEVRRHSLDAPSAVFCLRSLRLVSLPIGGNTTAAAGTPAPSSPPPPPSHVRLWFTTSGSTTVEVRNAWEATSLSDVPSVKDVQRAWVPAASSPYASGSSPHLRTDAHGQLVATGAPVLLSTVNTRARLCVAVYGTAARSAGAEGVGEQSSPQQPALTDGTRRAMAEAETGEAALQRCVAAVRKRAIRRYSKKLAKQVAGGDDGSSEKEETGSSEVTAAEAFLQCLNAVAMRVDNYVEVDLQPSLVASSERQGHARHRLLLSCVSGTVRLSRTTVLEIQGQWVKLPRKVAHLSDAYVPSPRLWALRCSCVVRRTGGEEGHDSAYPSTAAGGTADATAEENRVPLAQEVLEAVRGYDVTVSSVPLDYSDPSEETVQKVLPGLSYDKLVVRMRQADRSLQPYRETITTSAAVDTPNEDEEVAMSEETVALLEHTFGPTGVAHYAYMSDASHKVAMVHFVFGDAYTTRTVLNVTCAAIGTAAAAAINAAPTSACEHNDYRPTPLSPSGAPPLPHPPSPSTVQIVCDSLTRSSTLYSFLPEAVVLQMFPGVSRRRYPPELTWYHGSLAIDADTEQTRREEGQAAWQRGLTEQSLGSQQRPSPLVVSAVTHHPYESLPLVVESSLTRCFEGRSLFVFGGISTATGAASARAFVLDVSSQKWLPLKVHKPSSSNSVLRARYGHTAVFRASDGAVYVFGGRGRAEGGNDADGSVPSSPVLSDVWRLQWDAETATIHCTEVMCTVADVPSFAANSSLIALENAGGADGSSGLARWRHAAVLHDDYLMVLGGLSSSGSCCSCRDLVYLDMRTREWSARRSFGNDAPSPRYGHAAAISNATSLYVFGGWTDGEDDGAASALAKRRKTVDSTISSDTDASDAAGGNGSTHEAVAVADFYKMDLITRMWSRVEPNGTLRPPPLDLADMTACQLDSCAVLFLVGGRVVDAAAADVDVDDASSAQLSVFLFSTATLFWRRVRMDCTPVPTRFGLRAVASAVTSAKMANGGVRGAAALNDSTRLRRSLPARGQRVGDIVIVGGLPLNEAAVVDTSPAITLLLAAGNGSTKGMQGPAANAGLRTVEAAVNRSPSVHRVQRTPRLPSMPRGTTPAHSAPRRPATGPPRPTPRRPVPPALAWTQQQHQQQLRRSNDDDMDLDESPPIAATARSPLSIRKSVTRLHSATTPGRRATTIPFNPQRPSCYSTLTWRQQRQLVRRLYTNDLKIRAAHLETLEGQVHLERTAPTFQSNRSGSRSPRAQATATTAQPSRVSSAPFQRAAYDTTLKSTPKEKESTPSSAAATPTPVAHRDLRSAFLAHGSSSSSGTSAGSSMAASSSASASPSPSSSSLSLQRSASAVSEGLAQELSGGDRHADESNERRDGIVAEKEEDEATPQTPCESASESDADAHLDHKDHIRGDEAHEGSPDASEAENNEIADYASSPGGAAAAAVDDDDREYEDSFASSSSAHSDEVDGGDAAALEPAKPVQPLVHIPPAPVPLPAEPHSSNSNDVSCDALDATQAGKEVVDHMHTPPQSAGSLSCASPRSAHDEREDEEEEDSAATALQGSEDAAEQLYVAAPSELTESEEAPSDAPLSRDVAAAPAGATEEEEERAEGEHHDRGVTPFSANVAPSPSTVLPIAEEGSAFEKTSDASEGDDDASAAPLSAPSAKPECEHSEDEGDESESSWGQQQQQQQPAEAAAFTPHTPESLEAEAASAAAKEKEEADAEDKLSSVAADDHAVLPVREPEEQPHDDCSKGEGKTKDGGAANAYDGEDDEDDWESLSQDDTESAAEHSMKTPSPAPSENAGEAAEAPQPLAGADGTTEREDDDDELVPPPAPREHQTPAGSSASMSLSSASVPAPEPERAVSQNSNSDDLEKESNEDEAVSETESEAASDVEAEVPVMTDSSATSPDHPAAMPAAASDAESDKSTDDATPPTSMASETPTPHDEKADAASHEEVSEASLDDEKVAVVQPRATLSDASSDAYDDDFNDAAAEKANPLPVPKSPSTPAASQHFGVEEAEASAKVPSAATSEEEEEQRDVEPEVLGTPATAPSEAPSDGSQLSSQHLQDEAQAREVPIAVPGATSGDYDDDFDEAAAVAAAEEEKGERFEKTPSLAASADSSADANGGKEASNSEVEKSAVHTPVTNVSTLHEETSMHSADAHEGDNDATSSQEQESAEEAENREVDVPPLPPAPVSAAEDEAASDRVSEEGEEEAERAAPQAPASSTSEHPAPENASEHSAEDVATAEPPVEETPLSSSPATPVAELTPATPHLSASASDDDKGEDDHDHNDMNNEEEAKEEPPLSEASPAQSERLLPTTPPPEHVEEAEEEDEEEEGEASTPKQSSEVSLTPPPPSPPRDDDNGEPSRTHDSAILIHDDILDGDSAEDEAKEEGETTEAKLAVPAALEGMHDAPAGESGVDASARAATLSSHASSKSAFTAHTPAEHVVPGDQDSDADADDHGSTQEEEESNVDHENPVAPSASASQHTPSPPASEHQSEGELAAETTEATPSSAPPAPSPPPAEVQPEKERDNEEDEAAGMSAVAPTAAVAASSLTPLSVIDSEKDAVNDEEEEEESYAASALASGKAEEVEGAPPLSPPHAVDDKDEKVKANDLAASGTPLAVVDLPQEESNASELHKLSAHVSADHLSRGDEQAEKTSIVASDEDREQPTDERSDVFETDAGGDNSGDALLQKEDDAAEQLMAFAAEGSEEPQYSSSIPAENEAHEHGDEEGQQTRIVAEEEEKAAQLSSLQSASDAPVSSPPLNEFAEEEQHAAPHHSDHGEDIAAAATDEATSLSPDTASEPESDTEPHDAPMYHGNEEDKEGGGILLNEFITTAVSAHAVATPPHPSVSSPALMAEEEEEHRSPPAADKSRDDEEQEEGVSAPLVAPDLLEHGSASSASAASSSHLAEGSEALPGGENVNASVPENVAAATPPAHSLREETSEEAQQEELSDLASQADVAPAADAAEASDVDGPARVAADERGAATPMDALSEHSLLSEVSDDHSTAEANPFAPPALQEALSHDEEDEEAEAGEDDAENHDRLSSPAVAAVVPPALHGEEDDELQELSPDKSTSGQATVITEDEEGAVTPPLAPTTADDGEESPATPHDAPSASERDSHHTMSSAEEGSDSAAIPFAAHMAAAPRYNDNTSSASELDDEPEAEVAPVSAPKVDKTPAVAADATPGTAEEGSDVWKELDTTSASSSHDKPLTPLAAAAPPTQVSAKDEEEELSAVAAADTAPPQQETSSEGAQADEHATRPQLMLDEWGEELTSPQESQPLTSNVPGATAPDTSDDEEAANATPDVELNDGRDLLDRRRGVEEAVQDDDFDF